MSIVPDDLCLELPEIPSVDDICLPGGVCLSYIWDSIGKIPGLADMPMDFFSQIGPAMAPLAPFFNLLDAILAVFRCLEAIGDFATSLDPTGIFECFPALAKAIDKLLKLLPYLSLPKMVKSIIKALAQLLRGIASDIRYIQSQAQRIIDMVDRAATINDATLDGLLVCSQKTVEDSAMSTAEALKGIGRIILIANILMGLFGGPEIPCFGELIGDNLAEGFDFIVDLLTNLAQILDEIANAIIDPDLVLTLALGKQKC